MSEVLWTSAEAAAATGGKAVGEWAVTGLSIDTRSLAEGDLFVPLKDVRDGHDFIPHARKTGAGAIMSERDDEAAPALIVDEALTAMRALAETARARSRAQRFAVTGSVGKTSLKEAIAHICETVGKTHKSLKSFNNHWGVPLTLATLPKDSAYGVFETGMNHAGELTDLSGLVKPHITVITKIAAAHLAHFASVDEIAAAKSEIFDGQIVGGTAVLNADDDYFEFLKSKAEARGLTVRTFGYADGADIRLSDASVSAGSVSATLTVAGNAYTLTIPADGAHHLMNGAAAVAAVLAAGIEVHTAVKALETLPQLAGRGEVFKAVLEGKTITVLDESYNANPASMRAAIAALSHRTGRRLAVLGDMKELGKDELDLHAALSEPLIEADVSRVITVGECMRALRGALPREKRAAQARDHHAAFDALNHEIEDGDVILVKASNSVGLGHLTAALKKYKGDGHAV